MNSPFARQVMPSAPFGGREVHDIDRNSFAPPSSASTVDYDRTERSHPTSHSAEYAYSQNQWAGHRTEVKKEHWLHGNPATVGGGPVLLAPTARSPFNLPIDEYNSTAIVRNQASRASSEVSMGSMREEKPKIEEDSTDILIKAATDLRGTRQALDEQVRNVIVSSSIQH